MSGETVKTRKSYSQEFKTQAIELAKELGSKEAAEKLGIKNFQTLAAWARYSKKMAEDEEFRTMEQLKAENKKLKKELADERQTVAILKDCTRFFCVENGK
ncbi:MAG: transposase [Bacteriovoracales bacterium]|nr:transposase [Bacteriovoracales bacterium]